MLGNRPAQIRNRSNEWQSHNWYSTQFDSCWLWPLRPPLVALVLAGIALRREGTTSFSVGGGGFSKWMFWAIVMITLPQVFGWFAFWGVGAPLPGGGIGNGWMSGFANDAVIFVNTFVIGRLVPVLAAWMVLRSVIDWSEGYTPLASILGAMFLLAIPASAALLQGWNDGTRFGTAAVLEGAWTYTASRIMPIAAGLAVIGAGCELRIWAASHPAHRLRRGFPDGLCALAPGRFDDVALEAA